MPIAVSTTFTAPTYSVKICKASGVDPNTSDCPGTLTNPASLSTGTLTFTANGHGIDLDASATYFVFFDYSTGGSGTVTIAATAFDGENDGSAAGWYIADDSRRLVGTEWRDRDDVLKIAIKGYAK